MAKIKINEKQAKVLKITLNENINKIKITQEQLNYIKEFESKKDRVSDIKIIKSPKGYFLGRTEYNQSLDREEIYSKDSSVVDSKEGVCRLYSKGEYNKEIQETETIFESDSTYQVIGNPKEACDISEDSMYGSKFNKPSEKVKQHFKKGVKKIADSKIKVENEESVKEDGSENVKQYVNRVGGAGMLKGNKYNEGDKVLIDMGDDTQETLTISDVKYFKAPKGKFSYLYYTIEYGEDMAFLEDDILEKSGSIKENEEILDEGGLTMTLFEFAQNIIDFLKASMTDSTPVPNKFLADLGVTEGGFKQALLDLGIISYIAYKGKTKYKVHKENLTNKIKRLYKSFKELKNDNEDKPKNTYTPPKNDVEEATTTGSVGGSYVQPKIWAKSPENSIHRKKPAYNGGTIVEDDEVMGTSDRCPKCGSYEYFKDEDFCNDCEDEKGHRDRIGDDGVVFENNETTDPYFKKMESITEKMLEVGQGDWFDDEFDELAEIGQNMGKSRGEVMNEWDDFVDTYMSDKTMKTESKDSTPFNKKVTFDDCVKLNNNKVAQKGGCSQGAVDNVVKVS